MLSLKAVELGGPMFSVEVPSVFVREVNCSRYSPERTSPECEERAQIGLGIFVVVAVLFLAVGLVIWRRMMRKVDDGPPTGEPGGSS